MVYTDESEALLIRHNPSQTVECSGTARPVMDIFRVPWKLGLIGYIPEACCMSRLQPPAEGPAWKSKS